MEEILAPTVYENAVAAGRAGANRSNAFNAGVLDCLKGRLDSVTPLSSPDLECTREYFDFQADVVEGRELSPIGEAPFGMGDVEWKQE